MERLKYRNGVVRSGQVFYNGEWHEVYLNNHVRIIEQTMNEVFNDLFGFPATVTCMIEGRHSRKSLHPKGKARDFRTWTSPTSGIQMSMEDKKKIKAEADKRLGSDYDVVIEKTHIHVEYDPKQSKATSPANSPDRTD